MLKNHNTEFGRLHHFDEILAGVPLVDKAQPQTMLPDVLTVGECCELMMANYNGWYRYRIGDIVKIAGYHHQSPKLIFMRRKSVELDLVGEKSTEVHLNTAMGRMAETRLTGSDLRLREYTFALDISQNPGRYALYVELTGSHTNYSAQSIG